MLQQHQIDQHERYVQHDEHNPWTVREHRNLKPNQHVVYRDLQFITPLVRSKKIK